jgi:hypothetical protein
MYKSRVLKKINYQNASCTFIKSIELLKNMPSIAQYIFCAYYQQEQRQPEFQLEDEAEAELQLEDEDELQLLTGAT